MDGQPTPGFGLPTSVGELPFDDHTTAVDFVLATQPTFPTVPRLRMDGGSLMDQVSSFIPGSTVVEPGILDLDAVADGPRPPDLDTTAIDTLTGPFEGLAVFIDTAERRDITSDESFTGVRVDVLGPISTALALRAAGMDTDEAVALGTRIASVTATRVLSHLRDALGEIMIAVVLDEPALIGAMHPTFPLLAHQIHGALVHVVDRLDETLFRGPLLIGAHVPGRTDWSTVIASGVSMLSVPVGGNLEGYAEELDAFLTAGGVIAWGAVPVDEPLGSTDELLWRRLSMSWCSLVGADVDPFLLRSHSLISTSDGLGHFDRNQVDDVMDLVGSMATRVRRQAAGTRLSLGA